MTKSIFRFDQISSDVYVKSKRSLPTVSRNKELSTVEIRLD